MQRVLVLLLAWVVLAACGSGADGDGSGGSVRPGESGADPTLSPGMTTHVFTRDVDTESGVRTEERNYLLYLPSGYDPADDRAWPLVIHLHGAGGEGTDVSAIEREPALPLLMMESGAYPFVMAAPQARPGEYWPYATSVIFDFLDHVRSRVNVDPDRIYVAGSSMGAIGAWHFAAEHPDVPAALVTLAGGWVVEGQAASTVGISEDLVPASVCDLKDIPVWAFHGADDLVVPVEESQAMIDALEECGADVRLTVFEGVGHGVGIQVWTDPELYSWMLAQGFDGVPETVELPVAPGCEALVDFGLAYEVPDGDGVQIDCENVYKTSPSGIEQTLNVYLPSEATRGDRFPAVIFFHGVGGPSWFPTDREQPIVEQWKFSLDTHARAVASLGVAGITFDYSSYPWRFDEGLVPSEEALGFAVTDAIEMWEYVSDHAEEFMIDPDRVCVWTSSTGSLVGSHLAIAGDPRLECAVVFAGPLDADFAGQYSPVDMVSTDMPPFFIARGSTDIMSNDSIDRFVRAAGDAGSDVVVMRVPAGMRFEYDDGDLPQTQEAIEHALEFVVENLGVGAS